MSNVKQDETTDETPAEILASKLIDAWCAEHGGKISWRRCIEIVAIVTKQPQAEVDRLLALGADDDGRCEMCGQSLSAAPDLPAPEIVREIERLTLVNDVIAKWPYTGYAFVAQNETVEQERATKYARSIALAAVKVALLKSSPQTQGGQARENDDGHLASASTGSSAKVGSTDAGASGQVAAEVKR